MKLGILGTGKIVREFLPWLAEHTPFTVQAICSTERSAELAQSLCGQYGVPQHTTNFLELLQWVDVVYIAVPNLQHVRYARVALEAGKHVIVEKPLAPTAAHASCRFKITGAGVLYFYCNRHGLMKAPDFRAAARHTPSQKLHLRASVLLSRWNIPVSCRVAINGTERPVDEHYGIHPKIYLLTERGMTEQGRDKFFVRMLSGKEEMERFEENRPCRAIDEQRDELRLIREQSARERFST